MRTKSLINPLIADIEDHLDRLYISNYKYKFSLYSFLKTLTASRPSAKEIYEYYAPILEDVIAYPEDFNGTKVQYRHYTAFLTMLVEDSRNYADEKLSQRKPRKKKVKTASDLVKSLKYKKENSEYKSIAPEDIIGAQTLVTFNDKYKVVSFLVAKENETLSIKGTTVINFDETHSFTKKIRNSGMVTEIVSGPVKSVERKIGELKTVAQKATGRINDDTLIIKVFR